METRRSPVAAPARLRAVTLGGAAALSACAVLSAAAQDGAPTTVIVQRAEKRCFVNLVHAVGYVVPRAPGVVMFNASGFRITEVLVRDGDTVKRGDRVASASGPAPAGSGSTGPVVVPIRSFVGGTILKTNAIVGALSSAKSDPLFTLAVGGELEVAADVLNVHVAQLRAGAPARVRLSDGTGLEGHVRQPPVRVDRASQFGQARIQIDRGTPRGVGQFARVAIEIDKSCGIGIPRTALTQSSEGPRVQVVQRGTIATRALRLGLLDETEAEVLSGIAEGDFVVADAGRSLRDGDKVRALFSDMTAAE